MFFFDRIQNYHSFTSLLKKKKNTYQYQCHNSLASFQCFNNTRSRLSLSLNSLGNMQFFMLLSVRCHFFKRCQLIIIYVEIALSTAVFKKDPIEIVGASELRRVGSGDVGSQVYGVEGRKRVTLGLVRPSGVFLCVQRLYLFTSTPF